MSTSNKPAPSSRTSGAEISRFDQARCRSFSYGVVIASLSDDNGFAVLDNARLLGRYRVQRRPKIFLVVHTDGRDYRYVLSHNVGRVQPAAQPDFNHRMPRSTLEEVKRHRGHDLKIGWRIQEFGSGVVRRTLNVIVYCLELVIVDLDPTDRDSFVEADQMRRHE